MELLGTVEMNNHEALVVDCLENLSYERVNYKGNDLLIGSNEDGIYNVLFHQAYTCGPKAFGGAKIKWHLKDGSVLETDGWWWSGGASKAAEYLGKQLISVSIQSISDLVDCFVFTSMLMEKEKALAMFAGVPEASRFMSYDDGWHAAHMIKVRMHDERIDPNSVDPHELWKELLRLRAERHSATLGI